MSKPATPSTSGTDKLKGIGAIVVTVITALLAFWWLALVAARLGTPPVVENDTVRLDEFQRAKDILLVVLPLFSATLAYWVGSKEAKDAKEDAASANDQLKAVLDVGDPGLLKKAEEHHRRAFL